MLLFKILNVSVSHCLCVYLSPSFFLCEHLYPSPEGEDVGGREESGWNTTEDYPGPLASAFPVTNLFFLPLSIHSKMNKTSLSLSPATSVVSTFQFLLASLPHPTAVVCHRSAPLQSYRS